MNLVDVMETAEVKDVSPAVSRRATPATGFSSAAGPWLLAIVVLGTSLRVAYLGKQSLWVDEVASWHFASSLDTAIRAERTNPPLYYVLLHFWISAFGTSEAALRSMSAVAGAILIGAVYGLARRLMSREAAIFAALYQSVSSFQIYYSQEARTFSLLALLVVLHAWALWNALKSGSGKKRVIFFGGSALAGATALYLHFIAVFFLAGFGVYVLLRRRTALVQFMISDAIAFGLFSPWLFMMVRAASKGQHRSHLLLKLPQAYFSFLFGDSLIPLDKAAVDHVGKTLSAYAPILIAALLSLALLLPAIVAAWKRWKDAMTFAVVGATVPVLLAFMVSFKVMLFDERYLISAAPFLYMVLAGGFAELWQGQIPSRSWVLGACGAAIFAGLTLLSLYNYYFTARFGKEEWREAMAYVENSCSGKTLLLFEPNFIHFNYDYYQRCNLPFLALDTRNEGASQVASELQDAVKGYESVWVIRSHSDDSVVETVVGETLAKDSYREFPAGEGIAVSHFHH